MSRILCEFRFPTGEVKYGVWCDTADLLVTRRTFTSKEDAEQFRQRWQQEADEFCRGPIDSLVRDAVIEVARLDPGSLEGAYQTGVRSRDVQDMLGVKTPTRKDFPTLYGEPPPVGALGEQDVTLYVEYGGGIEFPTRVSRETGWVSGPTSEEQHYDEMRSNDECGWVGFGP